MLVVVGVFAEFRTESSLNKTKYPNFRAGNVLKCMYVYSEAVAKFRANELLYSNLKVCGADFGTWI